MALYDIAFRREVTFLAVCIIIGAGERLGPAPRPEDGDLLIAADGGYLWCLELGLRPHLLIGDFDSLNGDLPPDIETVRLAVDKDDTDMSAAIEAGWQQGFRRFHLHGGTGGRLDHTLGNLQLIAGLAQRGGVGLLFDRDCAATAISDGGSVRFPAGSAGTVSVFACAGTATGVWEEGLHFPLADATLESGFPLGVSNRLTGERARISVGAGTLLILYPHGVTPCFE